MKNAHIIRAWKDQEYYNSLTSEQRAALPANPAGELSAVESELIAGGGGGDTSSIPVCGFLTIKLTGGFGCDECEIK